MTRHFTRSFLAGLVVLLPVGGLVFSVLYMEVTISESWLARQDYYFPGLGILAVVVAIYLVGLIVSTFIGRWLWKLLDGLLKSVPAVGDLYKTLKQILGYGEGEDAMFHRVVFVPSRESDAYQLGLVTDELREEDGSEKWVVFVPGSPNPTIGQLLLIDPEKLRTSSIPVNEAFKTLVAVGKNPISTQGI